MHKQIEEVIFGDTLVSYPIDIDIEEEIKKFPTHVQRFYQGFRAPATEESAFFKDLQQVVESMNVHFSQEPESYSEKWQLRKKEYQSLLAALQVAADTKEDLPLLLLSRSIGCKADSWLTKILNGWNEEWNQLPTKLNTILAKYMADDKLIINLFPVPQDSYVKQKYATLICDYYVVYQRMLKFKQELTDASANADKKESINDNTEKRQSADHSRHLTTQYLMLSAKKDQKIRELKSENFKLEKELQSTLIENGRKNNTAASYMRQNEKLITKLEDLSNNLNQLYQKNNHLSDENKLLKTQVEILTFENHELATAQEKKGDENFHLTKENQRLRHEVKSLEDKVRKLQGEISEIHSHFTKRSTELVGLKKEIAKFRQGISQEQKQHIRDYKQAYQKSSQISEKIQEDIINRLGDVNQALEDFSISDLLSSQVKSGNYS